MFGCCDFNTFIGDGSQRFQVQHVENGEKVTFTLTHDSSYELASFKVNGTEMKDQVKDDQITLTITEDTHIEVEFALITIKSTELVGNLVKKNYVYGEEFDPSGLTLVYTWSNGQVERIGLEKGAIETVTMDDDHILSTAYGKAIQIKHKEFYPEHPATAYFTTLGITIGAVDKNGNGESKYLTQADFDEINDYLEEKVDRDQWSAAGENDTIKASLKNDQTISGYKVISSKETPGLGSKVSDSKFSEQFIGIRPKKKTFKVKQDGGEIDAVTAATISSRAVIDAIQKAYDAYNKLSTRI